MPSLSRSLGLVVACVGAFAPGLPAVETAGPPRLPAQSSAGRQPGGAPVDLQLNLGGSPSFEGLDPDMVVGVAFLGNLRWWAADVPGTMSAGAALSIVYPRRLPRPIGNPVDPGATTGSTNPLGGLQTALSDAPGIEKVLTALRSDYLREKLVRAGRIATFEDRGALRVHLYPRDRWESVAPGTSLVLPDGSKDALRAGESPEDFLVRHGTTWDAVVARNRSLMVWPHAVRHEPSMHLGEVAVRLDSVQAISATLLHEAGHLGDGGQGCSTDTETYGPDGTHFMSEILSPTRAFSEGWANYLAAEVPGFFRDYLRNPPRVLKVEASHSTRENPVYFELMFPELGDFLSNESWVGHMLLRISEELPGGRAAVDAALRAMPRTCRTMADFLHAYAQGSAPSTGTEEAGSLALVERLVMLLLEITGKKDHEALYRQLIADAQLPGGLGPGTVNRDRDPVGVMGIFRGIFDLSPGRGAKGEKSMTETPAPQRPGPDLPSAVRAGRLRPLPTGGRGRMMVPTSCRPMIDEPGVGAVEIRVPAGTAVPAPVLTEPTGFLGQ